MRDPTPATPSSQPQSTHSPPSSSWLHTAHILTDEVPPPSPSSLAPTSKSHAPTFPALSSSSYSDAVSVHFSSRMSDVAPESRDHHPSSLITKSITSANGEHPCRLPASPTSHPPWRPNAHPTSLSLSTAVPLALPFALPSPHTSPRTDTPQLPSTVTTLQLASEALSTIPQELPSAAHVPIAAADLLSALHRKTKKAPAIQSPHPGSIRSRSAVTTPVPPSLLLGAKHDSFDVTAASSRATTPTHTPTGRAKRQRRERNPATPMLSVSTLPSIEHNDRRRSARVAKAVTASASNSPSMPNLALFGFSPYLENLVMNAKDTDRRTRSGGRATRPSVDRAPTRVRRTAAKSKNRDTDPDGPDDEAKLELYRQLCIISYQLQAHLDMVPHKSLQELRAHFATPPPDEADGMLASTAPAENGAPPDPSRATTPAVDVHKYHQPPLPVASTSYYAQPIVVKTEPPQSPQLSHLESQPSKPAFSPESSPEVALMHSLRPAYHHDPPPYSAYTQRASPPRHSPEPYPCSTKLDSVENEPMSPVYRPARVNIMSISALMSGPTPSKRRSPSPETILTPPRPVESLPSFMQEWTQDDEMASQFLSACAAAVPKPDTTELDRLTQIAQLAAFDLEILSAPSTSQASTPPPHQPTEQQRREESSKFDPKRLNPLDTLDTRALYTREEEEYLEEIQANEDLYETVRYLASFDEVVDEWRAGELSRLRLQLEMRKAQIDRIWTCDRKFAWSNYANDRAGELYRAAAMEANHTRWQAEMELDLLAVHRRKTRALAKLTKDFWMPDVDHLGDAQTADLYRRFGKFLSAAKHTSIDDPLVRADIRKMHHALREQKRRSKQVEPVDQDDAVMQQADQEISETRAQSSNGVVEPAGAMDATIDVDAADPSYESGSEEQYDSDSSYASSSSSGISSLPSFSSVYSSPIVHSVVDADMAISDLDGVGSEVASVRDADMDSDVDADESLWARQLRLAKELAAENPTLSATASGLQTPVAGIHGGIGSALPSRAASPANSVKTQARKQRDRKRKKRPPPPGARLWKKGRVQQDGAPEEDAEMQQVQHGSGYQNGINHPFQEEMEQRRVASPKMQPSMLAMEEYHYRDQQRQVVQSYGYAMRPSYGGEYEYDRVQYDDPYSNGAGIRGYGSHPYPQTYPPAAPPMASYTRNNIDAHPHYARTPPPSDHMLHQPHHNPSYPHPYPPSQPPPSPRPHWHY